MARRLFLGVLLMAALAWARPASALARIGLGADWLVDPQDGAFQLTLAGEKQVVRGLDVGGRIGVLLLTSPSHLGVPIDASLRLRLGRFYVEGLAGPWIVFDAGDALKLHAAVGMGLVSRGGVTVGLEVGWLDPTSMLGLRVAFPF
jgi:hypothetical protein